VLEVVVARIDGLVIIIPAGKALSRPLERAWDKGSVAIRKQARVNSVNLSLNLRRNTRVNVIKHCRTFYRIYR